MTPEEVIQQEILGYITQNKYKDAYVRLMQIIDPDLYHVAQLVEEVRTHGHGQVVVNIGKGKVNSKLLSKSYL